MSTDSRGPRGGLSRGFDVFGIAVRVLMALCFVLTGSLLVEPREANASSTLIGAHDYDSPVRTAPPIHSSTERSPTETHSRRTGYNAVDHRSHEASVRSDDVLLQPIYGYDHPARNGEAAGAASTTVAEVGVQGLPHRARFARSDVAANTGDDAARLASNACRTNSVASVTRVLMFDDTKKAIKDVELGDQVMVLSTGAILAVKAQNETRVTVEFPDSFTWVADAQAVTYSRVGPGDDG